MPLSPLLQVCWRSQQGEVCHCLHFSRSAGEANKARYATVSASPGLLEKPTRQSRYATVSASPGLLEKPTRRGMPLSPLLQVCWRSQQGEVCHCLHFSWRSQQGEVCHCLRFSRSAGEANKARYATVSASPGLLEKPTRRCMPLSPLLQVCWRSQQGEVCHCLRFSRSAGEANKARYATVSASPGLLEKPTRRGMPLSPLLQVCWRSQQGEVCHCLHFSWRSQQGEVCHCLRFSRSAGEANKARYATVSASPGLLEKPTRRGMPLSPLLQVCWRSQQGEVCHCLRFSRSAGEANKARYATVSASPGLLEKPTRRGMPLSPLLQVCWRSQQGEVCHCLRFSRSASFCGSWNVYVQPCLTTNV